MRNMRFKKEIIKTYNAIAKDYDNEFCKTIYFQKELDFFLNRLPKGAKIIDVGCGPGYIAEYCEQNDFDVLGIDLAEKMLKIAKARCKATRFEKKDVEKFGYGKNKFGGIIALFILPYVSGFGKIIKKWKNALKPEGLLFAAVIAGRGEYHGPNPLNPKMKLFFKRTGKNEIKKLIVDNGFAILKTKTIIHKTEHEKNTEFFIVAQKAHNKLRLAKSTSH